MRNLGRSAAISIGIGFGFFMAACGGGGGGTVTPNPTTYVLSVNSTNPTTGVAIVVSAADNNGAKNGTTSFTRTYNAAAPVTLTAPATASGNTFSSWTGCTSTSTVTCTVAMNSAMAVTANYTAVVPTIYVLTVNSTNPASGVAIQYYNTLYNVIENGTTSFMVPTLAGTTYVLSAPATAGGNNFASWTGCTSASTLTCTVTLNTNTTVTANYVTPGKTTPTVTVTTSASSITAAQALTVTIAVSGGSGNPTPTGSVKLTSGSYTSATTALSSGSAQINVPAGSLAAGSDTLTATYTPDSASTSTYNSAAGMSSAVTVAAAIITVNQSSSGPVVSDQLLGMNLATWYDVVSNRTAIVDAFQAAGIKSVRWPGGSWSDIYHWQTNTNCVAAPYALNPGQPNSNDTFANFVKDIVTPAGLDVALVANYGTNSACTGGGDPAEAAAWVTAALADGLTVSHMTVGNEVYGSGWEEDLHAVPNDPTTYAAAIAGTGGYFALVKAASPTTLVGVNVEPTVATWDQIVLAGAPYDFVEYHYYAETPGQETDTFLVQQAAQGLTAKINMIKAELVTAGKPNTPIFVGEVGGPYTNPGKQSWSISQGLYAGQVLGEMMNEGVSRLSWWMGFGNCWNSTGNFSSSLYGWQTFGAYSVFSDGPSDTGCPGAGPIGTMSPTARAFQLFSNVAVNGEHVLTASVAGDTTNVRAYAATNSGGTALVLFNRNATTSKSVAVTLSTQSSSTGVTVITYDKAIYDQTNATNPVWAAPTTTNMGAQSLPLTLTLTPWSMNVVIVR